MTSFRLALRGLCCTLLFAAPAAFAAIDIQPDCLDRGAVGSDYSVTFTASGGTAPYTWAVTGGSLPPGLTLSAAASLSGIPTIAGSYAFQLTATDAGSQSGSRDYVLVIEDAWNILAGAGAGPSNPNQVRVFTAGGVATPVNFLAYGATGYGVNVASGNIDGGSSWEIVTAPGPGAVYGPQIRGWTRTGAAIAKVNFFAYGTLKYGANVAVGDIDGDGYDEIVTAPGSGTIFGPHIRAWNYDGTAVSAIAKVNFFAFGTLKYGANVALGDIDGDCIDEILVAPGPGVIFGAQVRGFNYDGIALTAIAKVNFNAFALRYGANLAAGDVDSDHYDEVVVAPGPGPTNPNRFIGFNFDGGNVGPLPGYDVTAFTTLYGGEPGLADVADPAGAIPGGEDLLAAPGPDPTAPAAIKVYAYSGTSLILVNPSPYVMFPTLSFGVNPAGAKLGYQ